MPIPIYRFPILVTRIIVDCMDRMELVVVSQCSKRADMVLKLCGKNDVSYFNLAHEDTMELNALNEIELFLMEVERTDKQVFKNKEDKLVVYLIVTEELVIIDCDTRFAIKTENMNKINQYPEAPKYLTMKGARVPFLMSPDQELYTFWNDKTEGLLSIVDYFNENFNCTLELNFYDSEKELEVLSRFRKVMHYAIQPNVTVSNVFVDSQSQRIQDEDLSFLLENLKVNGDLRIFSEPSRDFQFNGRIQASSIDVGRWFTLRHLLNNDFERVELKETQFTEDEVKWFLDHWMSGGLPKLVRFRFGMFKDPERAMFPEVWRKFSRGNHIVFKYEGVIGNRSVTAEISALFWLSLFSMDVVYGELVEQGKEDAE